MSQYLFAAGENIQLPDGYEATPLLSSDPFFEAIAPLFPPGIRVVSVEPASGITKLVDQARTRVQQGDSIPETDLGILLTRLANHAQFALFWGNDAEDLPRASNLDELWQIIEPELLQQNGNWELYVLFDREPRQ